MKPPIPNNSMVLAVIPKNDLAVVATKEAAKAKRLERTALRFAVACLVGSVAIIGGAATIGLAPIVAPIMIWAGLISMVGGTASAVSFQFAADRATERQTQAIQKRADRLTAAARFALEQAVANGAIRVGLYLSVVPPEDETPKKVHVEGMMAIIDTFGRQKLGLTARILEGDGKNIDWMDRRNLSKLYLELSVAKLPNAILDSLRRELPTADIAAPVTREPEKILPRINCVPG
jgi:hypothetical protein